jgi:cobalt-zinc-cadmium resistance protein CzcA
VKFIVIVLKHLIIRWSNNGRCRIGLSNVACVQGVADVVAFGGGVKQYQIEVDPDKLRDYKLSLPDVYQAYVVNNAHTGCGYIEHGYEALVVRGAGLLKSADEIGDIVVSSQNGIPVFVKNIANVVVGLQPRNGIVGYNEHDDVVEGIVLLIKGRDALTVLQGVKEKIADLNNHRCRDCQKTFNALTKTPLHFSTYKGF